MRYVAIGLLALGFLAQSLPAFAEKVLFFTPSRVEMNAKDKVEVVNVTNLSSIARAYSISMEDLVMTEEGITKKVDGFDYSARRMVRFVPRQFVLKPGERQSIRVMMRAPRDLPDGDFHSHMQFLENVSKRNEINADIEQEENTSIQAPLAYSTLIPVIVSHGEVKTTISANSAKLITDSNGKKAVEIELTRQGNGQGRAFIDVAYVVDGEEKTASPRSTTYIYRELDKRKKIMALQNSIPSGAVIRVSIYDDSSSGAEPVKVIDITP